MWVRLCLLQSLVERKRRSSSLDCVGYNKLQERVEKSARSLNLLTLGCWLVVSS
jgi:hypothetical protein